jgi:soluble lytic murein transglycosylase-like protein
VSAGRELAAVETAIRSPDTPPGQLPALGRRQQFLYRALVANPPWRADALAQLAPSLVPVARANIEAGEQLRALTRPRDQLPAWRIVEPPPADELLGYYREAETEFGIEWQYLAAIHLVESRLGRIRGMSPAGAQGPMQFLPSTWAAYGRGDINSPRDSILAAARYLKAAGAPGNMARALYAYNHSDRYVRGISLYAEQMRLDERAWRGYYHWQVFYRTTSGDVELPVGYGS